MRAFRIFFIVWGIIAFIGGLYQPHQFIISALCLIMAGVSLLQEKIDEQWNQLNNK